VTSLSNVKNIASLMSAVERKKQVMQSRTVCGLQALTPKSLENISALTKAIVERQESRRC